MPAEMGGRAGVTLWTLIQFSGSGAAVMAACLPMYLLQEMTRSWPGGETTTRPFLALSPEAEDKFSERLEAFGLNSWLYLSGQERSLRASNWWPWAMVALPEEYRMAGHLFSIRRDREEFKFTSYYIGPHSLAEQGPSLVSVLLFRNRDTVMSRRGQDGFFLIYVNPDRHSRVIPADGADNDLLAAIEC